MTDFDGLTTITEVDDRYRKLFAERDCEHDQLAWLSLSEDHRRAHEALAFERKRVESAPTSDDPNHVRAHVLRNWAAQQGIPLAKKGRVPVEIVNAYRAAHDLPLIEVPVKIDRSTVSATSAEIREWARSRDIAVGVRGRVHPDVIAAYLVAHG